MAPLTMQGRAGSQAWIWLCVSLAPLWADGPRDVAAGIVLSANADLRHEGAGWFGTVGVVQEDLHHTSSERTMESQLIFGI